MKTPFQTEGLVKHKTHPGFPPMPGRVGGKHQQWTYLFPNGYGASVITGSGAYGSPGQPYELAVLHGPTADEAALCYATPIADDVEGWQTVSGINEKLAQIAALAVNPLCDHRRKEEDE